jgi:hypothetical protein
MRAKFRVSSVEKVGSCEKLTFHAVAKSEAYPADGSDEDNNYARWSPSASCEIMVANPDLHGKFEVGKKYYVDFIPAD